MAGQNKILLVIAGPTAVGKTKLSFELQTRLNSNIISADSRQVYKELSIGTAKPSLQEIEKYRIRLCDYVSIHDKYNAGIFEEHALDEIKNQFESSSIALACGGTGLYISAMVNGLNKFPEVDNAITEKWNAILGSEGIAYLQTEIKRLDPEYASILDLKNPHRLIRALTVIEAENKPYSYYLNQEKTLRDFKTQYLILDRPRKELYKRIDNRVLEMVKIGLFDECQSLIEHRSLKAIKTVGYSEAFDYLEGKTGRDEAIELIQRHSRQYAKRQITWFKKYTPGKWFHPEESESILDYLNDGLKL